jgi:hypothetical protein
VAEIGIMRGKRKGGKEAKDLEGRKKERQKSVEDEKRKWSKRMVSKLKFQ